MVDMFRTYSNVTRRDKKDSIFNIQYSATFDSCDLFKFAQNIVLPKQKELVLRFAVQRHLRASVFGKQYDVTRSHRHSVQVSGHVPFTRSHRNDRAFVLVLGRVRGQINAGRRLGFLGSPSDEDAISEGC